MSSLDPSRSSGSGLFVGVLHTEDRTAVEVVGPFRTLQDARDALDLIDWPAGGYVLGYALPLRLLTELP